MTSQNNAVGVILVNLGTPDEPTVPAIRRYLAEFLSDPRVVNLPRVIWLPVLYGFVLPFRPSKLTHKYQTIWGEKHAPIREITADLADAVQEALNGEPLEADVEVHYAMTYGNPSLSDTVDRLKASGIEKILVLPLFPQYSAATTAAVFDKLAKTFGKSPTVPSIRFISEYHQRSEYIHAITKSIEPRLGNLDQSTKLIFSFHGIPVQQAKRGDPYPDQCRRTAELVAHNLTLNDDQWMVTFQSRFGPAPWLQPYTDETLGGLPAQGYKKVMVVCPGFSADCLETLEEIDIENRNIFLEAGGTEFIYVPALNASPDHASMVAELVISHLYESEGPAD